MPQESLSFLNDTLKYLGFGEEMQINRDLEEQIAIGASSFELETDACFDGKTLINARLFFRRGKEPFQDRYYLNKYEAHLQYPGKPEKDVKKMFYIENNRHGVTFKQAFNLLQGRYVQRRIIDQNKDRHDWWVHLEPTLKSSDGYLYLRYIRHQFDLEKALEKYPIREMSSPEARERICNSLRRGNLQPVTFIFESGKVESRYLYVNADKALIGNVSLDTDGKQRKGSPIPITDLPEIEHPDGDAISESLLEDEPVPARKKAHL